MNGSWRTSSVAIAGIMTSVAVIIKAIAEEDYQSASEMISVLITACIGLFARDNKVRSESVGAE